jgi:urease accessory protein
MKLRTVCLASALLAVAWPALAHPGHDVSGFLHPFTGPDHMLAMVGVGMWSWLLSVRIRTAAILVPACFLAMMGLGAAAGFAGIKLPFAESAILASVFLLGGLMLAAIRLPAALAMPIVGVFAVFHGYAHALEAPAIDGGSYILSLLAATSLLHAAGLALGWSAQRLVGELGPRALGGLVLAGGALVLAAS